MAEPIYTNNKSLQGVLHEIKDELRDFISTRVELLRAELVDKWSAIKAAVPILAAGIALLAAALFAFTFGLVALFAVLVGGEYRWAIGAGIVFGIYAVIGAALAWMGSKQLSAEGVVPDRTLRVLKQDQQWIQTEAKAS